MVGLGGLLWPNSCPVPSLGLLFAPFSPSQGFIPITLPFSTPSAHGVGARVLHGTKLGRNQVLSSSWDPIMQVSPLAGAPGWVVHAKLDETAGK